MSQAAVPAPFQRRRNRHERRSAGAACVDRQYRAGYGCAVGPQQIGHGSLDVLRRGEAPQRSEEHTSELQSLIRISNAVFCLKKKTLKLPPAYNVQLIKAHV